MLTVRTLVNSRLSQKLIKDTNAPYHGSTGKVGEVLGMSSSSSGLHTFFPTLSVVSLGEEQAYNDIEHKTQNVILSTIELKAFTDKTSTVSAARNVMNYAGDVMISMGYEMFFGPQDMSTSEYNCVVARFRRYVGNGDSLY